MDFAWFWNDWLQILAQAKAAARHARARLKGFGPSMGYLRARRDGSAQLAILVGNNMGKKKGVAPLGAVVGRLNDGTAHLQVSECCISQIFLLTLCDQVCFIVL